MSAVGVTALALVVGCAPGPQPEARTSPVAASPSADVQAFSAGRMLAQVPVSAVRPGSVVSLADVRAVLEQNGSADARSADPLMLHASLKDPWLWSPRGISLSGATYGDLAGTDVLDTEQFVWAGSADAELVVAFGDMGPETLPPSLTELEPGILAADQGAAHQDETDPADPTLIR